jgi:hypothetical protein
MSIEACVAHAIHNDLDIVELLPDVHELPLEDLESYIENFIVDIQQSIVRAIRDLGDPYIRSKDSAGLCATLMKSGVTIPPSMLLKMCNTIMRLTEVDAQFIADTADGRSVYYMKLQVA